MSILHVLRFEDLSAGSTLSIIASQCPGILSKSIKDCCPVKCGANSMKWRCIAFLHLSLIRMANAIRLTAVAGVAVRPYCRYDAYGAFSSVR